jgi:hypothetical protein
MNQENLWRELTALPPEAQQSVADFIAFLRTRYDSSPTPRKTRRTRLADEPFIGLWRDRSEMNNSRAWILAFVNRNG